MFINTGFDWVATSLPHDYTFNIFQLQTQFITGKIGNSLRMSYVGLQVFNFECNIIQFHTFLSLVGTVFE